MAICSKCGRDKARHKCARCLAAHYCGPECQKADWKEHKLVCKPRIDIKKPTLTKGPKTVERFVKQVELAYAEAHRSNMLIVNVFVASEREFASAFIEAISSKFKVLDLFDDGTCKSPIVSCKALLDADVVVATPFSLAAATKLESVRRNIMIMPDTDEFIEGMKRAIAQKDERTTYFVDTDKVPRSVFKDCDHIKIRS